jgi:site-specific DNA-methyltransferase (adenine-specific)
MDCMEGMKQFPDKYFDLAIVDPPYGINIGDEVGGGAGAECCRSEENETSSSNRRRNAVRKQVTVGGGSL